MRSTNYGLSSTFSLNEFRSQIGSGKRADFTAKEKPRSNSRVINTNTNNNNPENPNLKSSSTKPGLLELDAVLKKWDRNSSRDTVGAVIKRLKNSKSALTFFRWLRATKNFKHDIFTYNCLLDKLVRERSHQDAGDAYQSMLAEGITPNGFTYAVLVQSSCLARDSDQSLKMFEEMVDKGYKPSSTLFFQVKKCLAVTETGTEAYELLGKVVEKRVAVDVMMKKALMIHFVSSDKPVEALRLFTSFCSSGWEPDSTTYSYAVLGFCRAGRVDDALELFNRRSDEDLSSSAWSSFLIALCKSERIGEAFEACRRRRSSVSPSPFELLTRLLIETGKQDHVEEACEEMIRETLYPDQETCHLVIQELCKAKKADAAYRLLQKMLVKSGYCPDMSTHTMLINELCRADRVEEAQQLLDGLPVRSQTSSLFSYNTLLHSLCKANKAHEALQIFNTMRMRRISPNGVSYTILIDGLCKVDMKRARSLFFRMRESGCVPQLATYKALLNGLMKRGSISEARGLFEEMIRSGITPDVITYSTLIHGLCLVKRYEQAEELFEAMISRGWSPNAVTHNCLLHGMCKRGQVDEAEKFFLAMVERGCSPDRVTFTTLLYGFCNVGEMEKAIRVFDEMIKKGNEPDVVVYNCLLKGFFNAGKPEDARQLFRVMVKRKMKPDVVSHNIMVDGFAKAELVDEAVEVFEEMKVHGCAPNAVTFSGLISGYCKQQRVGEALKLFKLMVRSECKPDRSTVNVLLDALSQACEEMEKEAEELLGEHGGMQLLPQSLWFQSSRRPPCPPRCNVSRSSNRFLSKGGHVEMSIANTWLKSGAFPCEGAIAM